MPVAPRVRLAEALQHGGRAPVDEAAQIPPESARAAIEGLHDAWRRRRQANARVVDEREHLQAGRLVLLGERGRRRQRTIRPAHLGDLLEHVQLHLGRADRVDGHVAAAAHVEQHRLPLDVLLPVLVVVVVVATATSTASAMLGGLLGEKSEALFGDLARLVPLQLLRAHARRVGRGARAERFPAFALLVQHLEALEVGEEAT